MTTIFRPPTTATVDGTAGYTNFTEAVGTLNAADVSCTLIVPPGTHTVSSNLTVNAKISLVIPKGALIQVDNTYTLTVNGRISAGGYQIFSWTGSGAFIFDKTIPRINAQWFGADPTSQGGSYADQGPAFNKAFATARNSGFNAANTVRCVYIPAGDYCVTTSIWAGDMGHVDIVGDGSGSTRIYAPISTANAVLDLTGLNNSTVSGLWIHGHYVGGSQNIGILMARSTINANAVCHFWDIRVTGYFTLAGIYNACMEASSLTNYHIELGNTAGQVASFNPKYGIFVGSTNVDSVSSLYTTLNDVNSMATFYMTHGMVSVCGQTGAVTENYYISGGFNVKITDYYVNGGDANEQKAVFHLVSSDLCSIKNGVVEADHYYGIHITGNVSGLVADESTQYNSGANSVYAIYQDSPDTATLKSSTLKGCCGKGDISIGNSSNNTFKFWGNGQDLTFTATLYSSAGDLIQYQSGITVAITTVGGPVNSLILHP